MKRNLILSFLIGLFFFSVPSLVEAASADSREMTVEHYDKTTKKELKQTLKKTFKSTKKNQPMEKKGVGGALLVLLAFILPPLAVFFKVGFGSAFWINLLLTLLIWIPGVIHALIVITN